MTKWPCPGEQHWQDLSLATYWQHFTLRARVFRAVRAGGQLKEGNFPWEACLHRLGPLRTHAMLCYVSAQVRGEVKSKVKGEAPLPRVHACLTDPAVSSRGGAHRLQPGPAFPGSLWPNNPHFSCFYKQWQDLQIYKSINGLYSPISHFNNTRRCLQSVDSFCPVPKAGLVGRRQRGGRIPSVSGCPAEPGPAAPAEGWQAATAFQALPRNPGAEAPGVFGK